MDPATLGAYALFELVLCLTPGPAVLYVVSTGLTQGHGKSFFANFGILIGNVIYFVVSATGLSAILMASYNVFFAIKWAGAAYLLWLGVTALFGKAHSFKVKKDAAPRSGLKILLGGVVLQLANPKAIVFFAAVLPLFIDTHRPVVIQFVILAAASTAIEFCVQGMYGLLSGQAARLAERPVFALWLERVAGSVLILGAVLMATIKKA